MPALLDSSSLLTSEETDQILINYAIDTLTHHVKLPRTCDPLSFFFSAFLPQIDTRSYIERILRYTKCSKTVFPHAVVLLKRLRKKDSRLQLSPYNLHRLVITAVVISAKFIDHACYSNAYYARIGGISSVGEMNILEVEMLKLLNYRVLVTVDEIVQVCNANNEK